MKRKNQLSILGMALLLSAAFAACTQSENEPDGMLPEGRIELVPTAEPVAAWNAGDAGTRADAALPSSITGGELSVIIKSIAGDNPVLSCNYYSVSALGKLTRLPFASHPGEMEAPLNVLGPGLYLIEGNGEVNLTTDGITYRSYCIINNGEDNIGADGKLRLSIEIQCGGLRLNVKHTDGTDYIGGDITATLKNVTREGTGSFDVKTLTAAAPAAIWGDIDTSSSVNTGTQLMELAVGGKTYRVNAPRQISFTQGRLYTFNVRVGATGIIVSSDDLGIGDFEVKPSTDAEAEYVLLYEGQRANLLAIPGATAYWVAPVDAKVNTEWTDVDFSTVCPAGWHVPTKDDFAAMTGIPADEQYHNTNNIAAIQAVLPGDAPGYWSITDREGDDDFAWCMLTSGRGVYIFSVGKQMNDLNVRCVHIK